MKEGLGYVWTYILHNHKYNNFGNIHVVATDVATRHERLGHP